MDLPDNVIAFPAGAVSTLEHLAAEAPAPYISPNRVEQHFDFRLFDNPEEMETALRAKIAEGATARLFASDCRDWKSATAIRPHELPASMQDFHEPYRVNGETRYWSRPWNVLRKNGEDYTGYVMAAPGGPMNADPLAEVGCPYTVRGFDYDYVGVLWLNDFVWRDGWKVDPSTVFDAGLRELTNGIRRKPELASELVARVARAYRILLTRALKGLYLWVPDERTRRHIEASLLN